MQEESLFTKKRYIALLRCSTKGQADTSLDAQAKIIHDFARDRQMIHVDTVKLAGVTGSIPGVRHDLADLIRRKQERNDYDVLLVYDATRLTRGGVAHGLAVEYQFRSVGVQIVFVRDTLPPGDMGDAMRALHYMSGKELARSIGIGGTRGRSAALVEGRAAHTMAPPYGTDRLYLMPDGTPRHVLRNLADGRQERIHPRTGEVLETFGRNPNSGAPAHCPRHKGDTVVLVPGDPRRVEVLRSIFRWHFVDGWGYPRIAKELNTRGESSATGKHWGHGVVRQMLLNPVYLGAGLANLRTNATYAMRGKVGPICVETDEQTLARGYPPLRVRPPEDWFYREEPALADLLPQPIKAAALSKQRAHLDALASGTSPARCRDRHRESPYILKGILRSLQGDQPMTGHTTGPSTGRRRYYVATRAKSVPVRDSILNRQIHAESLEAAVLRLLQHVFQDAPTIQQKITRAANAALTNAQRNFADLDAKRGELEREKRKLGLALEELDEVGREVLRDKLQQIQARIRALGAEIEAADNASAKLIDIDALAQRAASRLQSLAEGIGDLPPRALRAVLETFVNRAVVDLETKVVEIELALPAWAEIDAALLCLDANASYRCVNQAQRIIICRIELCRVGRAYVPCDKCGRRRAA